MGKMPERYSFPEEPFIGPRWSNHPSRQAAWLGNGAGGEAAFFIGRSS